MERGDLLIDEVSELSATGNEVRGEIDHWKPVDIFGIVEELKFRNVKNSQSEYLYDLNNCC